MMNFLLTLAAGLVCGLLLFKLKVPGGMMLGAVLGAMLLGIFTQRAYMPAAAKLTAQITIGAFIGISVEREDIAHLPRLLKPFLLLISCMLITNIALGFLIHWVSPLDLLTSLLSTAPGGMTEIPIIAGDMGADAIKVTALQFVRMVAGIGLFPTFIYQLDKRLNKKHPSAAQAPANNPCLQKSREAPQTEKNTQTRKRVFSCLFTLLTAAAGGLLGGWTGLPAGTLIGATAGAILFSLFTGRGYLPPFARRAAQLLSGAFIGSGIQYSDLLEISQCLVPAVILLVGYVLNCLVSSYFLRRHFGFSRKMSMLAATPAGASDMALICADIGVNDPDLVFLQVLRLIVVVTLFPQVIALIASLAG